MNQVHSAADNATQGNEFAVEALKQLLTLASLIFALTITFWRDVLGSGDDVRWPILLPICWSLLLIAIWTAWVAIADAAKTVGQSTEAGGIYAFGDGKPRTLARIAQWTFLVGLVALGVFAVCNLLHLMNAP